MVMVTQCPSPRMMGEVKLGLTGDLHFTCFCWRDTECGEHFAFEQKRGEVILYFKGAFMVNPYSFLKCHRLG